MNDKTLAALVGPLLFTGLWLLFGGRSQDHPALVTVLGLLVGSFLFLLAYYFAIRGGTVRALFFLGLAALPMGMLLGTIGLA